MPDASVGAKEQMVNFDKTQPVHVNTIVKKVIWEYKPYDCYYSRWGRGGAITNFPSEYLTLHVGGRHTELTS
jgi:hypothetical protein